MRVGWSSNPSWESLIIGHIYIYIYRYNPIWLLIIPLICGLVNNHYIAAVHKPLLLDRWPSPTIGPYAHIWIDCHGSYESASHHIKSIWVFPKIGVHPNHPLKNRVFHVKPSILGETPQFLETPICLWTYHFPLTLMHPAFSNASLVVLLAMPGSDIRQNMCFVSELFPSWWFQPMWKNIKIWLSPQVGMKMKHIWNHHLVSL